MGELHIRAEYTTDALKKYGNFSCLLLASIALFHCDKIVKELIPVCIQNYIREDGQGSNPIGSP